MITLSLVVSLFAGTSNVTNAEEAASSELPFSDISKHWAKDTILQAYNAGLVEGFEDGTFRPDDVVKADQFVVMMLRAHSVTTNGKTEFDPAWFAYLEKEKPGHLNRIKDAISKNKFNFQIQSTGYWATPFVNQLYDMNYLTTNDVQYPKNYDLFKKQIKRDEASYLLGAWFVKYEDIYDEKYSDYVRRNSRIKDIGNFSQHTGLYTPSILISGLMNGYPDGHFYPQRYVTRAEALTMVLRLRDKALRKPFQPNLNGLFYTTNEGKIYLFEDKYQMDSYNKMLELAKKHVTSGYIYRMGGSEIVIFSTKSDFEKHMYFSKTGQFHLRPSNELRALISRDTNQIGFNYPITSTFKTSNQYLNSLYELLAGSGKGKELRKKVEAYIVETAQKDFSFNGKSFSYREIGDRYQVFLNY